MIILPGKSMGPTSITELDNFKRLHRFIVISEIKSNTIPDIFDCIFNIFTNNTVFNNESKTKVSVINVSETHGSIHNKNDRLRSIFFHSGSCDQNIDYVNSESVITFNHVDYNISSTELQAEKPTVDDCIKTSYERSKIPLVRTKRYSTQQILVPTPNYYEEYDMVKLSNNEDDHMSRCDDLKEMAMSNDERRWNNNCFRIRFGDLFDRFTKLLRIDFKIENLTDMGTNFSSTDQDFDDLLYELACEVKVNMETRGFSCASIVVSSTGFNVTELKSYMNLNNMELQINKMLFFSELERLFSNLDWRFSDNNLLLYLRHDKVRVKITNAFNINGIVEDSTDMVTDQMSNFIQNNITTPFTI